MHQAVAGPAQDHHKTTHTHKFKTTMVGSRQDLTYLARPWQDHDSIEAGE